MSKITLIDAEEFKGLTTFFLSNGHKLNIPTDKLIEFIKVNEMNVKTESCGVGLTCDPNCREWESCSTQDADDYLSDNWVSVCSKYYNEVVLGKENL